MNNSWWQEFVRFFLQGMTLKQLIHMLIIFIILIIITPTSTKEWVNTHNPEILPGYWMYYVLLFCMSYVLNGAIISGTQCILKRREESKARDEKNRTEKATREMFDSLSLKEQMFIAFAVDANNRLIVERGDEAIISLLGKGLLSLSGFNSGRPSKDRLQIPGNYHNDCYIRFSGKSKHLMDEVIESEKSG